MKTITEENYVDVAETVIRQLKERSMRSNGGQGSMVTTSRIRNLLAMTADIYNQVLNLPQDTLDAQTVSRIRYLRVRVVYEAGRDPKLTKPFIEEAKLLDILNEIGNSRKNFILFNHYMEALVAFHRYYGGKDSGRREGPMGSHLL